MLDACRFPHGESLREQLCGDQRGQEMGDDGIAIFAIDDVEVAVREDDGLQGGDVR